MRLLILGGQPSAGVMVCRFTEHEDPVSVLLKPFTADGFVGLCRTQLRWVRCFEGLTPRVGDLTIDVVDRAVSREGAPVHGSAKRYTLLKLLARHPNRVLTREPIAQGARGSGTGAASNVIDVYVGSPRRKLGGGAERRLIHTARRVGYQPRAPRS